MDSNRDMVREDGVVISINSNMSILYWNWLGADQMNFDKLYYWHA